jgi:hypothetical protein
MQGGLRYPASSTGRRDYCDGEGNSGQRGCAHDHEPAGLGSLTYRRAVLDHAETTAAGAGDSCPRRFAPGNQMQLAQWQSSALAMRLALYG